MSKSIIPILSILAVLTSCIKNDIPYPLVVPHIINMEVEGGTVAIDQTKYAVTITLGETVDLKNVVIKSCKIDREDARMSEDLVGHHNLTTPMKLKLSVYEDFEWTISAVRPIERYFTVEKQVGAAVIDDVNRRVVVEVSKKKADLAAINVLSCKLGPKQVTNYSIDFNSPVNFADENGDAVPRELEVSYFGETEIWRLFVSKSDKSLSLNNVNVWTREAYLTAVGIEGEENGFKFRQKDAGEDWTLVDPSSISTNGGEFTAHLTDLAPDTTYEFFAYSGDEMLDVAEFTTNPESQLPNASFEVISPVSGSNYYKWYDPASSIPDCRTEFWGSGNGNETIGGSGGMGFVITAPDDDDKKDGDRSVVCKSVNAVVKFAAGNIFAGSWNGMVGTKGGKVLFGRPWTTRPKALRIWAKYSSGTITHIDGVPDGVTVTTSDYDMGMVKVALGCWDYRKYGGTKESPILWNTTDKSTFVDFTTDSSTIAYGEVYFHGNGYQTLNGVRTSENVGEWRQITIPLDYRDLATEPTHIVVSCASSAYGDYFTGCETARLWLDAFELIY
ncbi:MAG: PCMD domain-containing protein [Candidatus Cryptobacteroides sp.]